MENTSGWNKQFVVLYEDIYLLIAWWSASGSTSLSRCNLSPHVAFRYDTRRMARSSSIHEIITIWIDILPLDKNLKILLRCLTFLSSNVIFISTPD